MIINYIIWLLFMGYVLGENVEYYRNVWNENIKKSNKWKRPVNNSEFDNYSDDNVDAGTYDFIIVGAGSTGATLAARLSENKNWKILLLDAGHNESDFSIMPGAFFPIQSSEINWGYLTTPQENACYGCKNKQCDMARGKVLGGSSAINAILFVRGNRGDFDYWCGQGGNKGWCYKDLLPYFVKTENATMVDTERNKTLRGFSGPVSVSYNLPMPIFLPYFINATKEYGYKNADYNSGDQLDVFTEMQVNTKFGRRDSSNQGYLQPALKDKKRKLTVITRALAIKIVTSKHSKKKHAHKIKYIHNKRTYVATAKKEIIISAGSINSPQLLILSGIGPKEELRKHGILEVADLPVGENLEDHQTVFNLQIGNNLTKNDAPFDEVLEQYTQGDGSLSYTFGQAVGFTQVNTQNSQNFIPEVEYIMFQISDFIRPEWIYRQSNYDTNMIESLTNSKLNSILTHIMLLHPKSRGWVRLNSSNPIHFPLINTNYLSNPEDIQVLIGAIENLERVLETPTFRSINASLSPSYIKVCDVLHGREYWDCVIRHKLSGIFHPVSTCRMGNDTKTSVVDHHLLVHGFDNLRVVDASVFPHSTSGHPNAVCMMMGEKLSDEIRKKYVS